MTAVASQGLGNAEAKRRLATDGPNALPTARRRDTLAIAVEVVRDPIFLLLVASAGIYLLLGDLREALILAASVVVVIAITVTQEKKSERALEALRDLSSPRALVVRDGVEQRIAGAEVVRGDLLILSEGDRVPADARLVVANDLLIDESLITGESLPVEKRVTLEAERDGHAYSGTLVVKGQGYAEVAATGARTELGRIGVSLATIEIEKTTLERETVRVVKLIAMVALALCVLLGTFYVATRGDWLAGILAGLTLAMAILPEEFPVVLTVFLALGAWRIARRGVLTRRMPAVEMLGAATVLCVDKKGTLTENRMTLAELFCGGRWRPPREVETDEAARLLESAALACELLPFDPMERAIVSGAERAVPSTTLYRREWRLEKDYPLTSEFLAVCHGWRTPQGGATLAIKGAPETVLAACTMDDAERQMALAEATEAAERGLRLLAVARADWKAETWAADPATYRFDWLGYVALADPRALQCLRRWRFAGGPASASS